MPIATPAKPAATDAVVVSPSDAGRGAGAGADVGDCARAIDERVVGAGVVAVSAVGARVGKKDGVASRGSGMGAASTRANASTAAPT